MSEKKIEEFQFILDSLDEFNKLNKSDESPFYWMNLAIEHNFNIPEKLMEALSDVFIEKMKELPSIKYKYAFISHRLGLIK